MTDLPRKRTLMEAFEQASEEVRRWPTWKQQLVKGQDFRVEHMNKDNQDQSQKCSQDHAIRESE